MIILQIPQILIFGFMIAAFFSSIIMHGKLTTPKETQESTRIFSQIIATILVGLAYWWGGAFTIMGFWQVILILSLVFDLMYGLTRTNIVQQYNAFYTMYSIVMKLPLLYVTGFIRFT